MRLLAIDSASSVLSAAVSCGEQIFYKETETEIKQSEAAMDCIESLVKSAGLQPKDLEGVLCMGGPGSFTGLRIGYSIAKGLSLSLSIPFAPVPTLDCITLGIVNNKEQKNDAVILAVIEASKNAYFYAFFRSNKDCMIERLTADADGNASQIAGEIKSYDEKIILTGPGAASLHALIYSLPYEQKSIIFNNEKRGYAKEMLAIAQIKKLLDNVKNSNAYLNSGPEYNRLTDAEQKRLK